MTPRDRTTQPAAKGATPLAAYGLLVLVSLIWSVNTILTRAGVFHLELPAFSLVFWRWVVALAILLVVGGPRLWRTRAVYLRHWKLIVAIALLSVSSFNLLQYTALEHTTATNWGIISAAMPAMIFLLTWLAGQERASTRQVLGLVAATLGVLAVVSRGSLSVLLSLELNPGDLMALAALFCWSIYSVLLRRLPAGLDPLAFLTAQVLVGFVGIVPFYGIDLAAGRVMAVDTNTLLIVLYMGIFPSILAYVFWNLAVARIGANVSGMFTNLAPVMIAVLAVLFLDESFALFHLAGMALIFLGIYLAAEIRLGALRRG